MSLDDNACNAELLRVYALHRLKILDTEIDIHFNRIAEVAAQICMTARASINFVDSKRTWMKSSYGFTRSEVPREDTFCNIAIHEKEILIVNDAQNDERFKDLPVVKGPPYLKFYAGAAIFCEDQQPVGVVCVTDTQPRELTLAQRQGLISLAKLVSRILEMKGLHQDLAEGKIDPKDFPLMCEAVHDELVNSSLFSTFYNMASGIQHEVNNPLSIVVGKARLLKENFHKKTADEVQREVNVIHEASLRLAEALKLINIFPFS